jgi:chemotaxis protein CheX
MRTDVYNAFIVSAGEVLNTEADVHTTRGPLSLERDVYVTDEVTVLLSLVGQVWGMVLYGMSFATAKALVSRIMGQEVEQFDELTQSGIGELGNVITGQASTRLATSGYTVQISVPTLIVGKQSAISTLDIDRLVVPLKTQIGVVRLDLALRESK